MIAYDAAFMGEYDSAWGVAHKVAWLNNHDPSKLQYAALDLTCKRYHPRWSARDYIEGDWLAHRIEHKPIENGAEVRQLSDVPAVLHAHTGTSLLGPQALHLLSNRLRACPRCLRSGYHSIVHQIPAIRECPLHEGTPLVDRCARCGRPFGEFRLRRSGDGFACVGCCTSFLDVGGLRYVSQPWLETERNVIGPIVQWAKSLGDVRIEWPTEHGVPLFRVAGTADLQSITNREAYFWCLRDIAPAPIAQRHLCPAPAGLTTIKRVRADDPSHTSRMHDPSRRAHFRSQVETVVTEAKRHIASMIDGHTECIKSAAQILTTTAHHLHPRLRCNESLCAIAQGHYLWLIRVAQYIKDLMSFDTPVEHHGPEFLGCLRRNLLSSFFSCVTGMVLLQDSYRRQDVTGRNYWNTWRCASNDPWLPWDTFADTGSSLQHPTHTACLNDGAVLEMAVCDQGRAIDQYLAGLNQCITMQWGRPLEKGTSTRLGHNRTSKSPRKAATQR